MPSCVIDTNIKDLPDNFLKNLSKIIAETLGKPEMVSAQFMIKIFKNDFKKMVVIF